MSLGRIGSGTKGDGNILGEMKQLYTRKNERKAQDGRRQREECERNRGGRIGRKKSVRAFVRRSR
jgi:hypothetical protein